MYKYMLEHEKYILNLINSKEEQDWENIKDYHLTQIEFLQHERLVHLLVAITFAFLFVTSYIITFLYPEALLIILDLILTVIDFFYIIHYYRLENGVKRWYEIYNRLSRKEVVAVFY
jgi:hypothetical protein